MSEPLSVEASTVLFYGVVWLAVTNFPAVRFLACLCPASSGKQLNPFIGTWALLRTRNGVVAFVFSD